MDPEVSTSRRFIIDRGSRAKRKCRKLKSIQFPGHTASHLQLPAGVGPAVSHLFAVPPVYLSAATVPRQACGSIARPPRKRPPSSLPYRKCLGPKFLFVPDAPPAEALPIKANDQAVPKSASATIRQHRQDNCEHFEVWDLPGAGTRFSMISFYAGYGETTPTRWTRSVKRGSERSGSSPGAPGSQNR